MQLYLVQHGASKSESEDPQRGLTDEGRRGVGHMAQYLAAVAIGPYGIEYSETLRARQTADILRNESPRSQRFGQLPPHGFARVNSTSRLGTPFPMSNPTCPPLRR